MPYKFAAWVLTALALGLSLWLHLLPALLAGMLVFLLTHQLARRLPRFFCRGGRGRVVAASLLASGVVAVVALAIAGILAFFHSDAGSLAKLLGKMADIIEGARSQLPQWLAAYLPADVDAIKLVVTEWLREHAAELQKAGKEAVLLGVHVLLGMVIGAMLAVQDEDDEASSRGPLTTALLERAVRLVDAFGRILAAQVKISAINAALTAIYLLLILPLFGVHVPLSKSLVAVTFFAGLLPVIGNLISNTAVVVVSLAHSLDAAVASLVFLVVIHKLEYFLNARIVGRGIGAKAWEVLIAMLVMEAAFGLPGMVAAPIFYAYLKDELKGQGLV